MLCTAFDALAIPTTSNPVRWALEDGSRFVRVYRSLLLAVRPKQLVQRRMIASRGWGAVVLGGATPTGA